MAVHDQLSREGDPLRAFFAAQFWPDGAVRCPRCGRRSDYTLKEGRYRCGTCVYTFHDFTGRWLNRCALSPAQWMAVLLFFVGARDGDVTKR